MESQIHKQCEIRNLGTDINITIRTEWEANVLINALKTLKEKQLVVGSEETGYNDFQLIPTADALIEGLEKAIKEQDARARKRNWKLDHSYEDKMQWGEDTAPITIPHWEQTIKLKMDKK